MPLRVQAAEKIISNLVAELYPIAHVTLAISTRSRDARTALYADANRKDITNDN